MNEDTTAIQANIIAGLREALGRAYEANRQLRTALCQVVDRTRTHAQNALDATFDVSVEARDFGD